MKNLLIIFLISLLANIANAQAPQGIPYQAVARNSSGNILASQNIRVRFSIRDSVATGTIVYRETFTPTTNPLGLFNVNVGTGTVVTGTFNGINWGTNAKFMQVEMDPTGGTSYVDMGTTQMMSVPYALSSATASSVTLTVSATGDTLYSGGGKYVIIPGISAANCTLPSPGTITGTATVCVGSTTTLVNATAGGTWSSGATGVASVGSTGAVSGVSAGTASISYTVSNSCGSTNTLRVVTVNALPLAGSITGAASVTSGSTTTLSNATTGGVWSSSNTSIATVSGTGVVSGVTAGTVSISYTVSNSCGSASATQLVTVNALSLNIGDNYGGGKIAYILQLGDPGYIPGETHGLITALSDQSSGTNWGCSGSSLVTSTALGTGEVNTAIVSAACGAGTAARLCADLVIGSYSDWYLPSLDELHKLYINRDIIGGFAVTGVFYWSSSEDDDEYPAALGVIFSYGGSWSFDKDLYLGYVRAVRSF